MLDTIRKLLRWVHVEGVGIYMKVINFFAGPGAGKSTNATGLFYNFKTRGINCEYVHEEAKEFTWENRSMTLECQPYIFAKQMRNLWRLKDKVEFAITDSPLLLSLAYLDKSKWPSSFSDYVLDQFNEFENINLFIHRTKKYVNTGRNQTELEAGQMDLKIRRILLDNQLPFFIIDSNSDLNSLSEKILKKY